MTFRYARHTTDLKRIEQFYKGIVRLEKSRGFEVKLAECRKLVESNHIPLETPQNPCRSKYGIMASDPDGYKIMFALKHQSGRQIVSVFCRRRKTQKKENAITLFST